MIKNPDPRIKNKLTIRAQNKHNNFGVGVDLQIQQLFRDKYGSTGSPLRDDKWKEFIQDAIRLKNGEPLDYIIGWAPFLNCKIDLSLKPLVPRTETEFWIEKAIREIKKFIQNNSRKTIKILDIFSGSGCIGVAALKNIPGSRITFSEIDPQLIKQIKISLKLNKISPKQYKLIKSDTFKNITGRYDFILANPPYIPLKIKNKVQKEVLK
ncbi:MAG: release factor glutamine methyltransferase, partial [Parcubacteria group bacterium Athens1014_26]